MTDVDEQKSLKKKIFPIEAQQLANVGVIGENIHHLLAFSVHFKRKSQLGCKNDSIHFWAFQSTFECLQKDFQLGLPPLKNILNFSVFKRLGIFFILLVFFFFLGGGALTPIYQYSFVQLTKKIERKFFRF